MFVFKYILKIGWENANLPWNKYSRIWISRSGKACFVIRNLTWWVVFIGVSRKIAFSTFKWNDNNFITSEIRPIRSLLSYMKYNNTGFLIAVDCRPRVNSLKQKQKRKNKQTNKQTNKNKNKTKQNKNGVPPACVHEQGIFLKFPFIYFGECTIALMYQLNKYPFFPYGKRNYQRRADRYTK